MFTHLDTISTAKGIERDLKLRDFEGKARLLQDAESRLAESDARTSTERSAAIHRLRRLVSVVSFGIAGRLAPTR